MAETDLAEAEQYLRHQASTGEWRVVATVHFEALALLLAEYEHRGTEIERLTAKVTEAGLLADVLDGEADTYPNGPGAQSLHSAADRIRGALAFEVHNPLNHEVW